MLVTKLKKESGLPKDFLDTLEEYCNCGAPNEITYTLSEIYCSSIFCKHKGVQRLVEMFDDLGILNMGEAKCRKFMDNFEIYNPYAIFSYDPDEDGPLFDGCSIDFSVSIYEEVKKHNSMLLWEYVKIGNLPGIRDDARKMFLDYENLDDFYDDLDDGGIEFIQELLGITGKDDELSVRATNIYNTLILFKEELMQCLDYVNIIKVNKYLNICLSRSVGAPFKSKQEFVAIMNQRYGDIVHINKLGRVTEDCDYLIWSGVGKDTTKVKDARRLIDAGGNIQIVTGSEFEDILKKYKNS